MTLSLVLRTAGLGLAAAAFSLSLAHAADLEVGASNPAKDSFTTFPKSIHLTFNQPIKASGAEVELMDPDGRRIRVTTPVATRDGLTVVPRLTDGPPVLGPYEVNWKAASASGAEAQGRYSFFVQQP